METAEEIRLKYVGFSMRDIYLYHCDKMGTRPNSGLATALPDQVGVFNGIKAMDMSRNYIGVNGFYPLLECIYVNHNLETIVMKDNGLTNDVMPVFCSIGTVHPSLAVIDLSNNPKLSTPAAQAILKMVQINPRIRRVILDNTLIPDDYLKRIYRTLAAREKAFEDADPSSKRVVHFERILYDELTGVDQGKLHQPVRSTRLHTYLRTEESFSFKRKWNDPFLSTLSPQEDEIITRVCEPRCSKDGFFDFQSVCTIFHNDLDEILVNAQDGDFQILFERADADGDGLINLEQLKLLLRNYLNQEAIKLKNEKIEVLRDNFIIFTAGKDTIDIKQLPELIELCDQKQLSSLRTSDVQAIVHYASPDGQEVVSEDNFVEAYMLYHCIASPIHNYIIISRKKPLAALNLQP